MKKYKAEKLLDKLESDKDAQNLIAQANSRYILFNVKEPRANFPGYDKNLDERLNSIAVTYLSIACAFAESGNLQKASHPFEKAASIIEYVHGPESNRGSGSVYYLLAGSLAYYASFQYSKAFLLLKNLELETEVAELIGSFLKKDFPALLSLLNKILLSDDYSDSTIAALNDPDEANTKIYLFIIARSFACLLEFIYSGNDDWLLSAKETLRDLLELLAVDEEPSMWWVVRILLVIIEGFNAASLWNTIRPNIITLDYEPVDKFVLSMAFKKNPCVELFVSQRLALKTALSTKGAVISLPTSSGKTRIAEIAILQNLLINPESIVLYLAPFRSLALEVESALSSTFDPLGYQVTHLYGGGYFTHTDSILIQESKVIIATPEKAKAIIRASPEIASRIKLVIIDEGHLLGLNQRHITNELFIEELRLHVDKNEGKLILLSAVLPNTQEIAEWITKDKECCSIQSEWRPSSQRFGLLYWTGKNVDLEWHGDIHSFNKNFIKPFVIEKPRSSKAFPSDKKQAVASCAIKLSSSGPVLIFVGRKNMVKSQAEQVLIASGLNKMPHNWDNTADWSRFELACQEAYGDESDIMEYAKYGIICHSGDLPNDVRQSIEKLMRNGNPKVIVCTSTLAQGVNLNVSSVIIANVSLGETHNLSVSDFWNIAGRAGRAFVDSEGKILYAVDNTKERWQIEQDKSKALEYFDSGKIDKVSSGFLGIIRKIMMIAEHTQISFELLLQLIAENDVTKIPSNEDQEVVSFIFDLLDDTLLALNLEFESYKLEDASSWIDDFFRMSLAYIQAQNNPKIDEHKFISILKARNDAVLKIAGKPEKWKSFVATGIPLSSSVAIDSMIDEILEVYNSYADSGKEESDLLKFLKSTEKIVNKFPSIHFRHKFDEIEIDKIRELWVSGKPFQEIITATKNGDNICNQYFAFTFPWGINAIARKLYHLGLEVEASAFEKLAIISELGVPSVLASNVYLSGVRSRVAAAELSTLMSKAFSERSLLELRMVIISNIDTLKEHCSDYVCKWLDVFMESTRTRLEFIERIPKFKYRSEKNFEDRILHVRKLGDQIFLCTPDYSEKIKVNSTTKLPFATVANNLGISFSYSLSEDNWQMNIRNPNLSFK